MFARCCLSLLLGSTLFATADKPIQNSLPPVIRLEPIREEPSFRIYEVIHPNWLLSHLRDSQPFHDHSGNVDYGLFEDEPGDIEPLNFDQLPIHETFIKGTTRDKFAWDITPAFPFLKEGEQILFLEKQREVHALAGYVFDARFKHFLHSQTRTTPKMIHTQMKLIEVPRSGILPDLGAMPQADLIKTLCEGSTVTHSGGESTMTWSGNTIEHRVHLSECHTAIDFRNQSTYTDADLDMNFSASIRNAQPASLFAGINYDANKSQILVLKSTTIDSKGSPVAPVIRDYRSEFVKLKDGHIVLSILVPPDFLNLLSVDSLPRSVKTLKLITRLPQAGFPKEALVLNISALLNQAGIPTSNKEWVVYDKERSRVYAKVNPKNADLIVSLFTELGPGYPPKTIHIHGELVTVDARIHRSVKLNQRQSVTLVYWV